MCRFLIAAFLFVLPCGTEAREAGRGAPVSVVAESIAFDDHALIGTRLEFRGAIRITSPDPAFGGITGLRWSEDERRLFAVTMQGGWFELAPVENAGQLTGIGAARGGHLLDLHGQPAVGVDADAEAIDTAGANGWTVLIGAQRLLLRYLHLDAKPVRAQMQASEARGGPFLNGRTPDVFRYETSGGVSFAELGPMTPAEYPTAFEGSGSYLVCARRSPQPRANCASFTSNGATRYRIGAAKAVEAAVPTDLDGVMLLQAPGDVGTRAILVQSGHPDETLAVFAPPDGAALEGIARRSQGAHTYFYLVSDSRRTAGAETILMKFELLPVPKKRR